LLDERDQSSVICGLQAGDRNAWTALYKGYSADVWRYVAQLIGPDVSDVADVVQETFLAAAASARKFDASQGTLWCWLTGIAHHRVSRYWRQVNKLARIQALAEVHAGELHRWLDESGTDLNLFGAEGTGGTGAWHPGRASRGLCRIAVGQVPR